MALKVGKRGKLFRLMDGRKIARNKYGTALDGGGHKAKAKATRQAGYINDATSKKQDTP